MPVDLERDGTLSHIEAESSETYLTRPQLFVALDCEQPLGTPVRASLDGIDEVAVGRAAERSVARDGRRLTVKLPDRWMSSAHARLQRSDGRWTIEDLGSKNGTTVNGNGCRQAALAHGDIVEVGHTLLLFRDALVADEPVVIDAADLRAPIPELTTFVVPLARRIAELAQVASRPLVSVIIGGDTGTGKEVVARAIHRLSGRQGAFVAVNCASIPASLFEAELFGARKGAFTGATEDRLGLVRAADGGTLFLDEIGDLPAGSQSAFLRVLQEREVLPLGATRPVTVDLRVVSATHRDLVSLVEKGSFRADLYARLGGLRLSLPPLEQRREDLGILIAALLRRVAPEPEKVKLTCRAARALFRYAWPLNVRELEKCLVTATALAGDGPIDASHLPDDVRAALTAPVAPAPPPAAVALSDEDRRTRDQLIRMLEEHDGNVAAVGRAMAKAPKQIHRWIKRYGLDLDGFRRGRER